MIDEYILEEYRELALQLKELKAKEMEMRIKICDELLEDKTIGTHNFTDFPGLKVKAVRKVNYSLDQEMIQQLIADDELSEEELDSIAIKYNLSLTKFKKIADMISEDFSDAIEVKPATPALTVEIG